MEPIAADEMVIEYVGQNIRQVRIPVLECLSVCVEKIMISLPDEDHVGQNIQFKFW